MTKKIQFLKSIQIELIFTGPSTSNLIDTSILLNNKFHSHYHLESLKELTNILKEIQHEK
jgi:hypothetical protein